MGDIKRLIDIKRGDIVKILSTGKFGIISDYQQVHNRYQLREVSGWQYGISDVEKISDDLISVLNAPSNQGESARLREALEKMLFILNQDTADISDMGVCISIASEALSSHIEDTTRKCAACNGSKFFDGSDGPACAACDGTGKHTEDTGIQLRPEVQWFAQQMELTLRANDHKGGWNEMSPRELATRLNEEVYELELAYYAGRNAERVIREASDVANFAMMIADNIRGFLPGINTDYVGPSKSSMGLMVNTEG
jgi:hypothetical protein